MANEVSGKYFQIINTGTSIITNYQKATLNNEIKKLSVADGAEWEKLSKNEKFLADIEEFLFKDPQKNSAEINSFKKYIETKKILASSCEIYLIGTNTYINKICRKLIENYFVSIGAKVLPEKEVNGGFDTAGYQGSGVESFVNGIIKLMERIVEIAENKQKEGYRVAVNPTGGMKPHVITCAAASMLVPGVEVYYIHEEFKELVIMPVLFYLPRGRELELLKKLITREPVSGNEFEKLHGEFKSEIDRCEKYGLVFVEEDEISGKPFRIQITKKGKSIISQLTGN